MPGGGGKGMLGGEGSMLGGRGVEEEEGVC